VKNFKKFFKDGYLPFLEHPLVNSSQIIDFETAEDIMDSFVTEISNSDENSQPKYTLKP
jgi:hypothetical protein